MSAIYKIIGQDGHEYGPATAGQIRQWIAEGRIERQTPIFVEGARDWNFVGLLPEFANCFMVGAPPTITPPKPATTPAGQMPRTNSFATAGLICAILSWTCCCGFPVNLLGLIFSLISLSQINQHPGVYEGRGLAIAGLILSSVNLFFALAFLLFNFMVNPPNVTWHFRTF